MKNNYFLLEVVFITWYFFQLQALCCHRFKGRALPHPDRVQELQLHAQLFMPTGTAQLKDKRKVLRAVNTQTILSTKQFCVPFMHHLFQTKKLLRDLHRSDFHSSAARGWRDEWSDPVLGICAHPSALPGGGRSRIPQTSSSLVSAGWCLVAQTGGEKPVVAEKWKNGCLFLSSLGQQQDDRSGCPCFGLLSKMCRLERCSAILLLHPLQGGEHCFHAHGGISSAQGTRGAKITSYFITQTRTSTSSSGTLILVTQNSSNVYGCSGIASAHALLDNRGKLGLKLMSHNYYPPGLHWDFA